jgi:chaperonin GroES
MIDEIENEATEDESAAEKRQELSLADFFEVRNGQIVPIHNIADMIDDSDLMLVGRRVKEGFESDQDSMQDWCDQVEAGLDLAKQERSSRSTPWPGAANFKSPVLMDACLTFSDRASIELLRHPNLCMVNVVGDDPDDSKQARADRVAKFQNWQLNVDMPEWRDEQDKLIYALPYHGTVFKKTYFDSGLGRPVSDLVTYPSFAVCNNVTSMDKLRRFSEVLEFPKNVVTEKMRSGNWLEVDLSYSGSQDQNDDGDFEGDKITTFIEQQTYLDLDHDGYEEPYTVVIQQSSGKVVRITPRFDPKEVSMRIDGIGDGTLEYVIIGRESGDTTEHDIRVLRIKPYDDVTMYGFLPDPQGGLLCVGYSHILSALVSGINATTNQLIDAGSIANMPGGWLAKGFRVKQGDVTFIPGEFKQTGLMAQDLQSGIMLNPTKEPSATLFSLRNDMIATAEKLSASADLASVLGQNSPAATTLAMVEEQQLATSAIMGRIYRAMSKEFEKLFILNGLYTDPEQYAKVVDDPQADFTADFNKKELDIVPSANPEVSSKMQRIQQASGEMANIEAVVQVGGNPRPIVEGYYKAIGSNNVAKIFPEMSPQQQLDDLLQRNPDLMAGIAQLADEQHKQAALQTEQIQAGNDMLRAQAAQLAAKAEQSKLDSEVLIHKTEQELDQLEAEVQKTRSETLLNLEKAESEQVKNRIDSYTAAAEIATQLNPEVVNVRPTGMETAPSNSTGS